MSVVDAGLLSNDVLPPVKTDAAGDDTLASTQFEREREGWQRIIYDYLVEWGRNPSQLEDEGIVAPSVEIIGRASEVAMELRDALTPCPAPLRVVADGEGGIAFEFRLGTLFASLNIGADGLVELVTFDNCRLKSRVSLRGGFPTA